MVEVILRIEIVAEVVACALCENHNPAAMRSYPWRLTFVERPFCRCVVFVDEEQAVSLLSRISTKRVQNAVGTQIWAVSTGLCGLVLPIAAFVAETDSPEEHRQKVGSPVASMTP